MFEDLLSEYKRREPSGSDTWNPLKSDLELWHRIRLFQVMAWSLHQLPFAVEEMKILDVGCGVGRSTRMMLDFGARPQNLIGIDLRPDAIEYARSVNPAITFQVVQDLDGWPLAQSFDLCLQCTVFSSILGTERRLALAAKMKTMLREGGYIFWWDALQANPFAGGDLLDPLTLFDGCEVVAHQTFSLLPQVAESLKQMNPLVRWQTRFLQRRAGYPPTHRAALLRKVPL